MAETWPELLLEFPWDEIVKLKGENPSKVGIKDTKIGRFKVVSDHIHYELRLSDREHFIVLIHPRFRRGKVYSPTISCYNMLCAFIAIDLHEVFIEDDKISFEDFEMKWTYDLNDENELQEFCDNMVDFNPLRINFFTNPIDQINFATRFGFD